MTRLGLVDRQDLLQWADSIQARSELPRLIRRLILETGQGVVHLGFPAGEGVSAGSWDGTVRATSATPYIPMGLSLWELSVKKGPSGKVDQDYAKRIATPDGSPTATCTYVAVMLRPWTKRIVWARDRTAKGRWKEVRALGIDDIETWLESAPITHAWISEVFGYHPYGLITAQTWWNTWSSATTPAFPSAVVLAGRDQTMATLREQLSRPGQLITIRGSSRDEAVAFVASLALADEDTDEGTILARTAFVSDVETWRRLRTHPSPLVLVALTEEVASEFAPGSPHVLIVPLTGTTDADIKLPPIDSLVVAQILQSEGLPERLARESGTLARLSLLAARRRLANKRELHQPRWAQHPATKTVRRVVLLGRWRESSPADRALVEKLVCLPYDVLREEVATLAAEDDPLLASISDTISIVSHVDAWLLLHGELRKDDLEAFHASARTLFAEIDPRLELPPEDHWRASWLGKNRAYSPDLRRGLAMTLALLGAYSDRTIEGAGITGREWAEWLVRETLEAANADAKCQIWVSLADILPLLAEAAPSAFLDAVRAGTRGQTPLLKGMFSDKANHTTFLTPSSAHTSLLWALERCAWSPDHFGFVLDLLARLTELDPGGRLMNRPFKSLKAILLPWYPQNSVSQERRLAAIDGLRDRHREVAWNVLLALLPEGHDTSMNIDEPDFRDWKPTTISVTMQEYVSFLGELCPRILTDAARDPARWVALIGKIDKLPPQERVAVLARLDELSGDSRLVTDGRAEIWEALRDLAARHREFASTDWALPSDEIEVLEATAAQFAPTDPTERWRWLFQDRMPVIPDIKRGNNAEGYTRALANMRVVAAAEIAASTDWAGLRRFALSVKLPDILSIALAQARQFEHEADFLSLLESDDQKEVAFATGYVSERFRDGGWSWLEDYLTSDELPSDQTAQLLLYTFDFPRAWERAEAMGEAVATSFWRHFRVYGLGGDFPYVDLVAGRLLSADRPGAALDLIALYSSDEDRSSQIRAEFIACGLEALLTRRASDPEILSFLQHADLTVLFSILEDSALSRERVALLEWAYLPVFGIGIRPKALHTTLSQDPAFFVDLIRSIYRPNPLHAEKEGQVAVEIVSEDTAAQQRAAIATNAYRLLMGWKTIPGQGVDGTLDAEQLETWVTTARILLAKSGHLESGDAHIGHILAWGPADADGTRPCLAVRKLVEKLESGRLEDGLRNELFNSRGVTSRGVFSGGDQERAVAARNFDQAAKFADHWPSAAALLRKLGERYAHEARRNDEEAERRRLGFDT